MHSSIPVFTLLAALAAPTAAQSLFVGSPDTAFGQATPPGSALTLLGACGGHVASLAGEGGELFLAAQFEHVYRHRADTQQAEAWAVLPGEHLVGIAVRGHQVLVATASGRVCSFDRSRGAELGHWDLPFPATSLCSDRGEILAGTSFGAVMRLEDGGTVGFLGSCGAAIRGIAASAGELFLASDGALVWRVDRISGFVTTSFALTAEPTGIAHHAGRLYVGTATGEVHTHDARSGALLATRDFGHPVSALALGLPSAGEAYCFGEFGACPCGASDPFGGCPSHVGLGARLLTYGSASVSADDLELAVLDLPPTTLGRFYMGAAAVQVPFGNGLLCAGAGGYGQFRFPVQSSQSSGFLGAFRFGPGLVAHSGPAFGALGTIHPGSTWRFQAWFRDAQNACGGGFNTSNATRVTFLP